MSADSVRSVAEKMLRKVGVRQAELSIVFLTGAAMRRLNRESLGHDFVTDVITFDLADVGRKKDRKKYCLSVDGEICVCPAEAVRNARLYGEPVERELLRYVAHGILHLLGHDDHSPAARQRMRQKEDELLAVQIENNHCGFGSGF
ncbi:MAG: rRNA maturation RNase YbeY [Candidatus Omnitrophica bacterium]|nr:rRNA maturation RNase YbeY [Candidatus Omnitrophota bacterium]